MSAGTLIFLLLIGGSLLAMFAMHRGGGSNGTGMGCGGHGHNSSDEHPRLHASHDADQASASTNAPSQGGRATRHRGCC